MKTLLLLKIFMLLMMFSLTACFNLSPQTRSMTSNDSLPDDQLYDLQKMDFATGTPVQTAQVLNFRGVSKSFENLTGSSVVDLGAGEPNVTNDMPTYSLSGAPGSITASMLYNEVKLAAGLCLLTVRKERAMAPAARKFFALLDFTAPSSNQNMVSAIKDAANRVSRTICGSNADSATQDMVQTEIASSFAPTDSLVTEGTYYSNVVDSALMVCTSFLSSSCALVNN